MHSNNSTPFFHPNCELDPYLLDRATTAAKRLAFTAGMPTDYWEDYRQELALEILRRSSMFDPARGSWSGFVSGVIKHRAAELASNELRRRREFLAVDLSCVRPYREGREARRERINTKVDVRRAVAGLPGRLQPLARLLMELTPTEASVVTRKSRSRIYQLMGELRSSFKRRGFRCGPCRSRMLAR